MIKLISKQPDHFFKHPKRFLYRLSIEKTLCPEDYLQCNYFKEYSPFQSTVYVVLEVK
jgi:hypothetical protein